MKEDGLTVREACKKLVTKKSWWDLKPRTLEARYYRHKKNMSDPTLGPPEFGSVAEEDRCLRF